MRDAPFTFQPGDILVFRGSELVSEAIRWGTWLSSFPRWQLAHPWQTCPSHVGMILEFCCDETEGRPARLLVESTTMGRRECLIRRTAHDGVQVQAPELRVADYHGAVEIWRPLPMYQLSTEEAILLTDIVMRYYLGDHCGYDALRATLSGTRVVRRLSTRQDPYKVFCSQLIHALLRRVGGGRVQVRDSAYVTPAGLVLEIEALGSYERIVSHWEGLTPYMVGGCA